MESVDFVNEIVYYAIILIRSAVVLRCVALLIGMGQSDEDQNTYKRKLKNTLIFYILMESVNQFRAIAEYYFL